MPVTLATSQIVGQAVRLLELAPISSLGDDSPEANDLSEQYDTALTYCLEQSDWSFASRLIALPAVAADTADSDLPYAFALPPEVVRIQDLRPDIQRYFPNDLEWRRDETLLRADDPGPLLLRCTCRTDSEAQMPATFRSAVSARLAHDLTLKWAKSLNRAKLLGDLFQRDLIAAKRADRRNASTIRHDGLHIDESAYWSREAVR